MSVLWLVLPALVVLLWLLLCYLLPEPPSDALNRRLEFEIEMHKDLHKLARTPMHSWTAADEKLILDNVRLLEELLRVERRLREDS
jgi:hypothetical protein